MNHIAVHGLTLEYVDLPATRPDLAPLLLLHEGLGCVAQWRNFPQELAARTGRRVLAWSRAGYGGSQPDVVPRQRDYLRREANEILPDLLATWQIERPLLVGHSDGASIALLFAAAFPEHALGVVAMAPHEFVEPETLAGIRAARHAWDTTDLRQRLGRYHRDPERVFLEWADTWLAPDYAAWTIEEELGRIRCPVLAIQGEGDEYATMRQIEVIADRVAGSRLLKLANCRHSPHKDQPEAVLQAIADFSRDLEPS